MMIEDLKKLDKNYRQSRLVLDNITIIIPTLGRPILESCFQSIVEGCNWPGQIIVVDQGSNPSVASWLGKMESLGISILHILSSQRGRASAVNRGLEQLKTQFVAITDDDCFVDVDWLTNMTKQLVENPQTIVTGSVVQAGEHEVLSVVTSKKPAIYYRPRLKFDSMSGGNMGTSKDVLNRVGLFDEDRRLRCAEDGEWAYRALRIGVPIIYKPEVRVYHYGWRDKNQRAAQYRTYARSHGAFYGKYLRKGDWFIALRVIVHHLRAFRRWLRGFTGGNWEHALSGRAYVTGLLPGIITGFGKGKVQ
jgi:GT2 family glycosyltransferase